MMQDICKCTHGTKNIIIQSNHNNIKLKVKIKIRYNRSSEQQNDRQTRNRSDLKHFKIFTLRY